MKKEEIKELIQFLENKKWKKFHLKQGDFELQIEQESSYAPPPPSTASNQVYTQPAAEKMQPTEKKKEGSYVKAPMVGTFYVSSSPDQPPFVKVGDKVEENTVVCIVEAMKVMNEVKAGKKGIIAEVLVDNSQPVEYGTNLFLIK